MFNNLKINVMKKRNLKSNLISYSIMLFMVVAMGISACENNAMDNSASNIPQDETVDPDNANSRLDNSKIYEKPDVMPEPQEGLGSFLAYIGENINYPESARNEGIQGKVYIAFVVSKEGTIKEVSVEKGLGHGLDEEALRVVSSYQKKWNPGYIDGKAVNTKMVLPVMYALDKKN